MYTQTHPPTHAYNVPPVRTCWRWVDCAISVNRERTSGRGPSCQARSYSPSTCVWMPCVGGGGGDACVLMLVVVVRVLPFCCISFCVLYFCQLTHGCTRIQIYIAHELLSRKQPFAHPHFNPEQNKTTLTQTKQTRIPHLLLTHPLPPPPSLADHGPDVAHHLQPRRHRRQSALGWLTWTPPIRYRCRYRQRRQLVSDMDESPREALARRVSDVHRADSRHLRTPSAEHFERFCNAWRQ